jgi:hypothetical protein
MEATGMSSRSVATVPNLFQVSQFLRLHDVQLESNSITISFNGLGSGGQDVRMASEKCPWPDATIQVEFQIYCGTRAEENTNVRCVGGGIFLKPLFSLLVRPLLKLEILRGLLVATRGLSGDDLLVYAQIDL